MKLKNLIEKFELDVKTSKKDLDREVGGAYVSDLLSDVIAHAKAGDIWITLQLHVNIVAVASMKDLAGIIIINGRQPEDQTLVKAEEEGIPVMISNLPAYELVGRLYQSGVPGRS